MKNINGKTIAFVVGMIALVCLLQYNWSHTAAMFGNYIENKIQAGIAAFGIEIAVIWLSWRLGQRKKNDNRVFLSVPGITLIGVIIMSMVANWSQGFYVSHGQKLTSQTLSQLNWMDVVFGSSLQYSCPESCLL